MRFRNAITGGEFGWPGAATDADLLTTEMGFQIGDAVIQVDQGMAALRGFKTVTAGEMTVADAIRLEYAGETKLTVPSTESGASRMPML